MNPNNRIRSRRTAAQLCVCMALPTLISAGGAARKDDSVPHSYLRHAKRRPSSSVHQQNRQHTDEAAVRQLANRQQHDEVAAHAVVDNEIRIDQNDNREQEGEHSLRRRAQSSPKWYVNWYQARCVQSCPKGQDGNPHCGGNARWKDLLFDTPEYCCSVTLNWMSFEECTAVDGQEVIPSTTLLTATIPEDGESSVTACPQEYSNESDYNSFDQVTQYITPTQGKVWECKDGPFSQYCNVFAPDWSSSSYGTVHYGNDDLGWKLVGDCIGQQVIPKVEEEEMEELGGTLESMGNPEHQGQKPGSEGGGSSLADFGFGTEGAGGSAAEGFAAGDNGAEDDEDVSQNHSGMAPSPGSVGSVSFSKPTGGRPRPTDVSASFQDGQQQADDGTASGPSSMYQVSGSVPSSSLHGGYEMYGAGGAYSAGSSEFGIGPSSTTGLWYPDWPTGKRQCFNDGGEPQWMKEKPSQYLFTSQYDCCKKHYSWTLSTCLGTEATSGVTNLSGTQGNGYYQTAPGTGYYQSPPNGGYYPTGGGYQTGGAGGSSSSSRPPRPTRPTGGSSSNQDGQIELSPPAPTEDTVIPSGGLSSSGNVSGGASTLSSTTGDMNKPQANPKPQDTQEVTSYWVMGPEGSMNIRPVEAQVVPQDEVMLDTVEDGKGNVISQCWRSGTSCDSHAAIFACCTACIQGVCI